MKGYVARKGERWYAVIYEGLDPVASRERRSWHPAGTERADAEELAGRLARERNSRDDAARSLSFGAYLTTRWLPGKKLDLATSTYDGYRRKIDRHILPALGTIGLRRLRPHHLETLYDQLLNPRGRRALAPKTVYEVHLVIRGSLADAVRRGLVSRNVALVAHAPRLRSIPKVEQQAWTADQLRTFLRAASGHRLFPALWLAATTGVRRSELLGLRWDDLDLEAGTVSVNRGLVAVAYEVHPLCRDIIAAGSRPLYEMEQVIPGIAPDDWDSDPIADAAELHRAGYDLEAERLLRPLLDQDRRCIDAWVHLGNMALDKRGPKVALGYYEAGVAVAERSLPDGFDGVLSRGLIDNRPFLRCLYGLGLCTWRQRR